MKLAFPGASLDGDTGRGNGTRGKRENTLYGLPRARRGASCTEWRVGSGRLRPWSNSPRSPRLGSAPRSPPFAVRRREPGGYIEPGQAMRRRWLCPHVPQEAREAVPPRWVHEIAPQMHPRPGRIGRRDAIPTAWAWRLFRPRCRSQPHPAGQG
jgi:hypothetical protein